MPAPSSRSRLGAARTDLGALDLPVEPPSAQPPASSEISEETTIQPARHPDLEPATDPTPETDPPSETGVEPVSARSSARGFLWTTLAWGCNRIVILGLTLFLARVLLPADFGLVTAALTIIAMLDAALDLGVGAAVVAEQGRGISYRTRTAFTLNVGLSAVIAGAGAAASPLIASLFHAESHAGLFALIFCYPLFRGAGQVNDAVLKRDLLFRRRTMVDVTRALVRVAVSVPMALTVGGALSIAVGIVASELVAMIVLWVLVPIRPAFRLRRDTVGTLLTFGGKVTVIRILGSVRSTFDYIVVGSLITATALGFYGMAYKLPELLIENVLWIFSAVALATYARARLAGHDALISAMLRATRLLALYGMAVGATLAVVARDAVVVLFSAQWAPAVMPMMLISISLGIMSIAWASGDVFSAMGKPGTLVLLDIPATVVMIALFLLAPRYGLVGVASVHLIFNSLYCIARLILVGKVTKIRAGALMRAVMPAVAVAGVTLGIGLGVRELLPSGQLISLILLSAVCAVVAVGTAALLARPALVDGLALVRPSRRTG